MGRFDSRVAIVTGGGQGIGRAIAARLSEEGAAAVIAELDEEAGLEAQEAIEGALFVRTDVSDEDSVRSAVSETVKRLGRLDFLVNNAGITIRKPIGELSAVEWHRVLGVNLTGAFLSSKYSAPYLTERRGAIVNISSTRALMSESDTEAYSASKGGILALTHSLAISLGPNVRVNCISPGWIDVSRHKKKSALRPERLSPDDHSQHPAGRVGVPEDVAALAAYLLSDEATFITGQNFLIDGGMTRKMIYLP